MRTYLVALFLIFIGDYIGAMCLDDYIEKYSTIEERPSNFDRTYYYSNQDYSGVASEINELANIEEPNMSLAVFIGEGNIFGLLPILKDRVSNVVILDRDSKLITYKRVELEAFKKSKDLDEYHSHMIDFACAVCSGFKNVQRDMAITFLQLCYKLPIITNEDFQKIKDAMVNVKIYFIQHDITDTTGTSNLGRAIHNSGLKITILNRTNLVEYMTPHMQIKFFGKEIIELSNLLINFEFLPIHPKAIILFGISHQHGEITHVTQGWDESLKSELNLIEENKKFHQ